MPKFTTKQRFPYPDTAVDSLNEPEQIHSALNAVEDRVWQLYDDSTQRSSRNPNPGEGEYSYLKSTKRDYRFNGSSWVDLIDATTETRVAAARKETTGTPIGHESQLVTDLATPPWTQKAGRLYEVRCKVPIDFSVFSGDSASVQVVMKTDAGAVWDRDVVHSTGAFSIGYTARLSARPAATGADVLNRVLTIWMQASTNDDAFIAATPTLAAYIDVHDIGPA